MGPKGGPTVRVKHDLEDVMAAQDAILVLQDSTIEENEEQGDELVNLDLLASDKANKNVELKKKKIGYNPMEHAELSHRGQKSSLLAQYDEEEESQGFVIQVGSTVNLKKKRAKAAADTDLSDTMKANTISLDYEKTKEVADYYTQEELVAFKKPKKKKKSKNLRKNAFDFADDQPVDENGDTPMDTFTQSNRNADISSINFVDDDDLQKALAKSRKLATQKQAVMKAEDIADIARQQESSIMDQDEDDQDNHRLVISDTSEFVRNLDITSVLARTPSESNLRPSQSTRSFVKQEATTAQSGVVSESQNVDMAHENADKLQYHDKEMNGHAEGSQSTPDVHMEEPDEWGLEEIQETPADQSALDAAEEELLARGGLAATMAILSRKGEIEKATEEDRIRDAKQRAKLEWLAEQKKRDALLATEKMQRKKSKGDRRDDREYERERAREERERIRETVDRFKDYKPEVNIVHKDEFGRELNPKQAYKQLARQFHGMQPKRNKTEKELRKIEEELKLKQMSSIDTPLNSATALAERTKQLGTAFIPLSVGNRGVLPSDLPKVKSVAPSSASAKSSTARPSGVVPAESSTTVPVNADTSPSTIISAPFTAVPSSTTTASATTTSSPFMTLPAAPSPATAPLQGRGKVTFGLSGGLKRKAPNVLLSESSKRRELE